MFCIKNICREGKVVIASCRNVVELRYILGSTESVKWSISFWAFPQSIEIAFQEPVERKKYVASKNTDLSIQELFPIRVTCTIKNCRK
jgi:hypothetical protein